jgi:hypothetical protein
MEEILSQSIEQIEEALCHGRCYLAAIAMNEVLSWPIGGLVTDWKTRGWLPHVVHAYLIAPDGRAFDASGFRDMDELLEDFIPSYKEPECRNTRFVEFGDAEDFRRAMRPIYVGASSDPEHRYYNPDFDERVRTEYDDYLDEHLPEIRRVVIERLDVEARARAEFGISAFAA